MADPSQLSNEQFLAWSAGNNIVPQNDTSRIAQFPGQGAQSATSMPMLGQIVRRNNNVPIVGHQRISSIPDNYNPAPGDDSDADDMELEARAAAAKKEAMSRRPPKQIPPFIQKLSSYLDDPSNHDQIRWADDGRSFIIPDEEKFATDLIPIMFKHNNYASFVRQLNMYGFHKKVGLTDNSMRASEKKTKIPSGYQHKYFRQGRPELQWLIEKPKPGSVAAKKRLGDDDAQDDDKFDARSSSRNTDLITMPKADLASVKNLQKEVESLQRSQQQIYAILKQMRDENNQYIKQASAMVANHERHESSINAILQFLATFYNQSLQGRDGTANMFPNHQGPQHGNVVEDMGDYSESPPVFEPDRAQLPKRRPLLLPAPEVRPKTEGASPSGQTERTATRSPQPASEQPSPKDSKYNLPGSSRSRNDDILNVINRSNAQTTSGTGTPRFDLSALQQYANKANGSLGPLTPEQRDSMLQIMADQSGTSTPNLSNLTSGNSGGGIGGGTNAPDPAMQSYIDYFNANEEQLSMLQRLQEEQDSRVQDLAGRLQPLSPNGSIPGLDIPPSPHSLNGGGSSAYGAYNPSSQGFDFDAFLNDDAFPPPDNEQDWTVPSFDDPPGEGGVAPDGDDLFGDEFGLGEDGPGGDGETVGGDGEGTGEDKGGRIVESVGTSSASPTPKATVQDQGDDGEAGGRTQGNKRRRLDR